MFKRLSKSSTPKKEDVSKEAQEILSKIEASLAEARRDQSFPKVNEGRRLAKELESLVSKFTKKEDKSLWSSQLIVVNGEIESVMASLMGTNASEESGSGGGATQAPLGGGGLFDGLQLGDTQEPQLSSSKPVESPMGGGAALDMGGLFAGLTIASTPSEPAQGLTGLSVDPPLAASPMPTDTTEAPKLVLDSQTPIPTPGESKEQEPQLQQSSSAGTGRRRKTKMRVGYARKEKAAAPEAVATLKDSQDDAGARLPLSEDTFVAPEPIPAEAENPVLALDGTSGENHESKSADQGQPDEKQEEEDDTVADEVGEPMLISNEMTTNPLVGLDQAPAEEASTEDDQEPISATKHDSTAPSLLGLEDLVGGNDETPEASQEAEDIPLDFDFGFDEGEIDYAEAASKLDKVKNANFQKLDFQNSQVLTVEKEVRTKRFGAADKIGEAKAKIEALEKEQLDAVEAEDFERADELNSSIDQAKDLYEKAIKEWYKVQEECEDVAAQFASNLEAKSEVKLKYSEALKKLGEALESRASGLDEKIASLEKENAEHEANMAEVLEEDMSRLSALNRVLQEREDEVKNKITEKTKEFIEEKEKHTEVRSKLEEELNEIKETLRKKEAEVSAVQKDIDELDGKIEKVESKFGKQLDRLSSERKDIEEDEKKFKELEDKLKAEQEVILKNIEEEKSRKEQLISDSEAATNSSLAAESQMKEDISNARKTDALRAELRDLRKEESDATSSTESLRLEVTQKKDELAECKSKLEEMLSAVDEANAVIKNAEEGIPKLEEQKKAAVAKKNFKDAAKFSAEAKSLTDDKSQAETSIVDLEKNVELAKEKRAEVEGIVEKLEEELSSVEAEGRKLQDRHLEITIDILNKSMEVAAAQEDFDEAAALQNEIEVAQELRKDLNLEASEQTEE